jgi:hypothetical protein
MAGSRFRPFDFLYLTPEPAGISRGIVARYTSRSGTLGYRAPDRAEEAQMSLRVIVFSDYV